MAIAIAKIIVDVPLMQTDQPYSYKVPKEFVDMLEVGMRVHVPFGKANRLIQGIVLGMEQESEMADEDLKEIAEVLDFSPVLTEEQLWLAEELRKSVFSYKISILKAMLPGFLNSSYDKILYPLEGLSQEDKERLFGSQESLAFFISRFRKAGRDDAIDSQRTFEVRVSGYRPEEGQNTVLDSSES